MELKFNVASFLHYYNWKRKHIATGYIPREVFFNYNNEESIKDVIINIEKTRSKFLEALDFIKGDRVLITSSIESSPGESPIFKRVNQLNRIKKERKENFRIEGIIDCIRFNYCDEIIEIKVR